MQTEAKHGNRPQARHRPIVERLGGAAWACAGLLVLGGGSSRAQTPRSEEARVLVHVQQLIEAGDLPGAQAAAAEALARSPKDGGVENLLGVIALERHDPHAAESRFEAAVRDAPALTAGALNLARVYLEFPGEFPEAEARAEALYRRMLRVDPHSDEAHVQLASIDERHARYAEAASQLRAVSAARAEAPVVLELRCSAAAATGDRSTADRSAAALRANPELTEADVLAMAGGLRVGRRADLLAGLLQAVAGRGALSPAGLELLGLAQDADGDPAAGRATLEAAFAREPGSAKLLAELAQVAEHEGKPQDALGYLAHARELAPGDAALANAFAQVCIRMKLLGEARNAMEVALKLDPHNAAYNLDMAKVTALSQDPLRAVPYLEAYHALRPEDPKGALLLGVVQFRVKDFAAAKPWLEQAARNPATAADAYLYLGSAARQQGQAAEARVVLERSAQLNGREPEVHAELGMLALGSKDFAAAAREFGQAVALEPENFTANFGLLQLYAQTRDPRRPEQLARFEKLKEDNEVLNRQAMRVIEIQPGTGAGAPQGSQ